jgi:hypothetical protein
MFAPNEMSANIDIPNSRHNRDLTQALLEPSPESVRSTFLSSRPINKKTSPSNRLPRNLESGETICSDASPEYVSSVHSGRRSDEEFKIGSEFSSSAHNSRIHVNMEVLSPAQVSGVLVTLWASVVASLLFAIYEEQWFRPKFTLDYDSSCYSQLFGQVCANLQGLNCSEKDGAIRGVLNGTTPFNGFFSLRGQVRHFCHYYVSCLLQSAGPAWGIVVALVSEWLYYYRR